MALHLEPDGQLEFGRPFNTVVKQVLRVKNVDSGSAIAFKVKTTAPKQYCVRPNSGKIDSFEALEVQVLLQPMAEDPAPDFKCKDKFLVQSIKISAEVMKLEGDELTRTLAELWAAAEASKKAGNDSAVEERKLRVVLLLAGENAAPTQGPTPPSIASSASESAPVSATVSTPDSSTPVRPPVAHSPTAPHIPSSAPARSDPDKDVREAKEQIRKLQSSCDAYKLEIDRLNQLRQRRGGSDADDDKKPKNVAHQQQQHSDGIPLMFALFLVILSFLLGVVFF